MLNLQAVEQKLLMHDPTFTQEHTHASLTSQRSALMSAFRPQYDEGDAEGKFLPNIQCSTILIISTGKSRIHLSIERWRVCEAWFSPGMAGVDSAGLGEVLQSILSRFSDAEKGRMVKVCSPLQLLSVRTEGYSSPAERVRDGRPIPITRPNPTIERFIATDPAS